MISGKRVITIMILFLLPACLFAQELESPETISLEETKIKVIDTTKIELEARSPISLTTKPKLIDSLGIYARERLWNLPPMATPQKIASPISADASRYHLRLTASSSYPKSLFYRMLFARTYDRTTGFIRLTREELSSEGTNGRGDRNSDLFRSGLSYRYNELSKIAVNLHASRKSVNWLLRSESDNVNLTEKEFFTFQTDLTWKHQFRPDRFITSTLDANLWKITHETTGKSDLEANLRFKFDLATNFPHMNPIHVGSKIEYLSTTDRRLEGDAEQHQKVIARLYLQDQFSSFKGFATSLELESVLIPVVGKSQLRLNPSITVISKLNNKFTLQVKAKSITRFPGMRDLFANFDVVTLGGNLKPEQILLSEVSFTNRPNKKFNFSLSSFAKEIDNFIALESQFDYYKYLLDEKHSLRNELAWLPNNIGKVRLYGGELETELHFNENLKLEMQYTHEFHENQIPYRPIDSGELNLTYKIGNSTIEFISEFFGSRHIDRKTDRKLEGYILLKPKWSMNISGIDGFIGGSFAIGENEPLEGYQWRKNYFNFGVEFQP